MTHFTRRGVLAGGAALAIAGMQARSSMAQTAYPSRPLTLMLPWAPGGGTDATARTIGMLLEKDLGQPVNVVNRTGGSGVVGHAALAAAPPDGYTIGMVTVEITMMHRQGLTELTPASYAPLGLLINNPPGVMVSASSPHKDIRALAEAIKASPPGKLKASGTGQGGIWHIALVGWLQAMGVRPDHVAWVPSQGAAPAMQDLAAGGIDLATCALPEGRTMIEAGKVRPLAVMAPQRNPLFPDVPTLKEGLGVDYAAGGWAGLAAPKDLPAEIRGKLVASIKKAFESRDFAEFIRSRGFVSQWAGGGDFAAFMAEEDKAMDKAMRAAGLVKT
jgi:tripartite-type tricarboxylate transporter receptor subunit TctC